MCLRVFLAYSLAVVSLSAYAEEGDLRSIPRSDALSKLDEHIVGAAIVNACDASFDWKRGLELTVVIGKNAYNELLHQLRTQKPNDPQNEKKRMMHCSRE
jgi:hypothetical protein